MTCAQHEKCWLFDKCVYVCGSHNLTHNSVAKCEEAILITTARDSVDDFGAHFEHLWKTGTEIASSTLEEMIQLQVDEAAKKQAKRSASRSVARGSDHDDTDAASLEVV